MVLGGTSLPLVVPIRLLLRVVLTRSGSLRWRGLCSRVLTGTLDGSYLSLMPMDELVFRRLYALHSQVRL